MLLGPDGKPLDPTGMFPTEVIQKKHYTGDETGITVELEKSNILYERELRMKVGYILRTTYPRYGWAVRTICSDIQARKHVAKTERTIGIGILLAELLHWGGSKAVQYINPQDWVTDEELKKIVVRLGGELLERARLLRSGKSQDQYSDTLPDGFADILPNVKRNIKTVTTKDELMDAINKHVKEQQKHESPTLDIMDES